ncbi:HPr kinase/phosphorylase [Cohnella faecalis]|uniref:Aldolase n=1 Tax=Cohnella faecalis TaxID=2315694 RepID=A0A398CMU0_9BACL|nr:aldolase [Cohnella faecalis]RIE03785.1 aldolase [Cohnella faecalis]
MVHTIQKQLYRAFGFAVESGFALPELPRLEGEAELADVVIEAADLTADWNRLVEPNRKSVVLENRILFQIPGTATFDIQDGKKIRVCPAEDADEDQVRLYILGTSMGALLLQRRILPLHGSAIAVDGKAYAIIGESGAGKSTLASAFLRQGYSLVSDDVIAVTFAEDGTPMVTPSYPQQKLWQQSLDGFGMSNEHYRPIFRRESKFAVPVVSSYHTEPLPLAGLFELVKSDGEEPSLAPVRSLERLAVLHAHTYRQFWIPRLGLTDWHFQKTAQLSGKAGIYRLQRPATGFTAPELAAIILNTIQKDGSTYGN